jgi:hypothetical protein
MRCLAVHANDDASLRSQSELLQKIADARTFGHVKRENPTVFGGQSRKLGMQVDLDLHRASVSVGQSFDEYAQPC